MMKVRVPARPRHAGAFPVLAGLFILVAVGVVLAIFFAPRKPEAPPASTMAFQPKPEKKAGDAPAENWQAPKLRQARHRPQPAVPKDTVAVETPEGRCIVEGRVTEIKTGKPIEHAEVTCASTALQDDEQRAKSAHTFTDKDGQYALHVEIKGSYVVQAHPNGYIQGSQVLELTEDKTARADFALSTGATISGRVSEKGSNVGAVGVQVVARGKAHSVARTDAQGRYTLSGLLPGDYEVRLDVADTPYMITGMVPTRNASVRTETQDVTGIDFAVEAAGQVWGYVMTRDQKPMQADVVLCSSASMMTQITDAAIRQSRPVAGRSQDDGYYELSNVPLNKEWRITAMPKESAPQLSEPFLLTSRQRVIRVDMHVSPGSNVYGRVLDTDNNPVPSAEVVCIPSYGQFFSPLDTPQAFRNATSNDDGTFMVPNLPVGEYQIMGRKDGFKFAAIGQPIYPDGYTEIRGIDIILTPVASGNSTVYGTVTDATGTALADVRLEMSMVGQSDMTAGASNTETDASGAYRFDKVPDGFVMLVAQKDGYQQQNVTAVKLDEPTDIVMQAAAVISGNVLIRETGSAPTGGYTVRASLASGAATPSIGMLMQGATGGSFSDPEGKFSITVGGGDYTVEARSPGLTPGRQLVSVAPGQETDGITIYLRESGARIEGRVVTYDGKSAQGAIVWTGSTTNPLSSVISGVGSGGANNGIQVGEDGTFVFSNLTADTYQVQAKLEGYAQGKSDPIVLDEGQKVTGITINLGAGSSLEGTVQINGYLEPGAIVMVVGGGVSQTTSTDSQGAYRFYNLPAGVYLGSAVSFAAGNAIMGLFTPLHARIQIVEGQTTVYNFGEPTNTAIEGRCVPPPPAGYYGYALLQMPGAPTSSLNIANPMAWLQDGSGAAQYVMGMAPITGGVFRIDNLVGGQYQLDVFVTSLGEVMLGNMNEVYRGMVTVTDGQVLNMDIPTAETTQ